MIMGEIKTIGDLDAFYDVADAADADKKPPVNFMCEYYKRMHALHAEIIKELELFTPEKLNSIGLEAELPPGAKQMANTFQDWFLKTIKNEDHIPDYARENLRKGLCAVGKFRGQTALFVPRPTTGRLTIGKIRAMAEEVYTKKTLDEFRISEYECCTYFMLELPPIEGPDDHRIEKLIENINK